MKPVFGLFLIICQFLIASVSAQEILWQKRYGTNAYDHIGDICYDHTGNLILGCTNNSSINGDKTVVGYGNSDYWIIKADSVGNILWQKDYGGSNFDKLEKISISNDGSIYCGGSSTSSISGSKTSLNYGGQDMWVIKLDSSGNLLWEANLGGYWDEELFAITATNDGGCVCGGYAQSGISGNKTQNVFGLFDGWVVKLSQTGVIEWQIDLGTTSWDYLFDLIELPDRTIICGLTGGGGASGNKTLSGNGGPDFWLVKLDSVGNILSQYVYGGIGSEELHDMVFTKDNSIICGGLSNSTVSFDKTGPCYGHYDAWVIKLDSSFNLVWDQTIGGSSMDNFKSIDVTPNGDVICGMYSQSPMSGNKYENSLGADDFWLVRLDSSGEIIWQNVIGGDQHDRLYSIKVSDKGNMICGGYSSSSLSGDVQYSEKGGWDLWMFEIKGGETSKVIGKIYEDINANNSLDSSENIVKHQKMIRADENRVFFTNSSGEYSLYLLPPDSCDYQPILNSPYYTPNPQFYSVKFDFPNQIDSLNDFALQSVGTFDDLCMNITPISAFRPGFNGNYMLNYENVGTTTQNPTIVFHLYPNVSFVSASVPPSAVYPDSVVWNLGALSPFQIGQILVTVNLSPSISIGSILNSYAQIRPIDNDFNPSCNNATWEVTVSGSMDPNDILVDQDTLFSTVFPNPPFLEYLIRFQNTGTDTAFTVKILNPIDTFKLDLNTLEFVAASHPMDMRFIYHERNMEFLFNNILLPDSNVNEPSSHGFIRYRIKPKSNLQSGDTITNYAAIYFDFNEPVITNTAETKIVTATGINFVEKNTEIKLYPNPATNELFVEIVGPPGKNFSIDLFNLYGQKTRALYHDRMGNTVWKGKFDLTGLNAGVYLLQYNVDGVTKSVKFVKM